MDLGHFFNNFDWFHISIASHAILNILIDNQHCNWFTNIRRSIFSVNHSGASASTVFTILTTFGTAHARHCYSRAELFTQSATQVRWSLPNVLTVPSNHYISNIVFTFNLICCAFTHSIAISLIINRDFFLCIGHHFFLSSRDCAMDWGTWAMTFAFHVLHKICCIKIFITTYSTFWCSISISLEELGPVAVFQ